MARLHWTPAALLLAFAAPLASSACGGDEPGEPSGSGGATAPSGGSTGTGGGAPASGGNTSGSGGSSPSSGGVSGVGGDSEPGGGGGSNTGNTGGSPGTGGSGGDGGSGSGGTPSGGGVVPGTSGYNCDAAEGSFAPGDVGVEEVAGGFDTPIYVTHAPDDPRLFVVEQDGAIKIIEDGAALETPFLDINERVASPADAMTNFERGLLGLAFHPDYAQNGLFFVHYSDTNGDTVIAEFQVTDDPNIADPESERIVLSEAQPNLNHNGGAIAFGSDGYLYIALGDGGGSYDSSNNGQDPSTILGALLRIDPLASGGEDYTSPAGNLIDTMGSAAPEVWDYGLRNPFRIAFDGCTGDLAIGDVGQDAKEELNIEKAGAGHHNYGWPILEGMTCTPENPPMGNQPAVIPDECGDTSGLTMPVFDYEHTNQGPSVIAGAPYRGSDYPALRGTWFFSDYGGGRLWYTTYDREAGTISGTEEITSSLGTVGGPASIQNGSDGELYISAASEGAILKITLGN